MKKIEVQSKSELVSNLTATLQEVRLYVMTKRANEEVLELLDKCEELTQAIWKAM